VNDRLESVFDPDIMQSFMFSLDLSHGKKKSAVNWSSTMIKKTDCRKI
jgi:hypothetical protein